MRKVVWLAVLLMASGFSFNLFAQEEPSFDLFYGNKDFGGAVLGYEQFLTHFGQVESVNFNYLTRSKRSEHAEVWPNYYGVSLEGAWAGGDKYDFPGKGVADYNAYWLMIWISGRLYANDNKTLRPYFDLAGGLGEGQLRAKGDEDEVDIDWTSINIVGLKTGAGVEIMLTKKYGLDLGLSVNGRVGTIGSFFEKSDLALAGAQLNLGLSRWTEK